MSIKQDTQDTVVKTVDPILEAELKQAVESINVIAVGAKAVGDIGKAQQDAITQLGQQNIDAMDAKQIEVIQTIESQTTASQWDYTRPNNPTNKINPTTLGATWKNTTSGEFFMCTDITADANVWKGSNGTIVKADGKESQGNDTIEGVDGVAQINPHAGTKGFGVCTLSDEWCRAKGWRKHPDHDNIDKEMYGVVERQVGVGTIVAKAMPKFYYKVVYDSTKNVNIQEEVLISMVPKEGYGLHDAFKNNGKEIPFILRTHYEASNSLGKNVANGQVQFQTNQMAVTTHTNNTGYSCIDKLKGYSTAKGQNKQPKVMDIVKTLNDTGKFNWAITSVQCENAVAMLGKAHFQALFKKANYNANNIDKSLCAYANKSPYTPRTSDYQFKSYDDPSVTFTRDGTNGSIFTLTGSGSDRRKITNTGHITGHIINEANKNLIQIGEYHINSQIYIFDGAKGDITKLDGSLHDITDNDTQKLLDLGFVSIGAGYGTNGSWGVAGARGFEADPYGTTKLRQDAGILKADFISSPGLESFGQDRAYIGTNVIKADYMRTSVGYNSSSYTGMWSKGYTPSNVNNSFKAMYLPEGTKAIDPQYQ